MNDWISPDNRIKKEIVVPGKYGLKPTEGSECCINISDCKFDASIYNSSPVTIGDNDTSFGRSLDKCLMMMNKGELARVTFKELPDDTSFTIKLISFKLESFIYEWDAKKKYDVAVKNKNKGVELFGTSIIDASHRFSKAIKVLASIPVDVSEPPHQVDCVDITLIRSLKANLYNNLASCHLKFQNYDAVVELCKKVTDLENGNIKALYKLAIAYDKAHDFDKSYEVLKKLLDIDPSNKVAIDKLKDVAGKIKDTNFRVNEMIKKMFVH